MKNHCTLAALHLFFAIFMVHAQEPAPVHMDNPVDLVGLTLEELCAKFGLPQRVYAVRGQAPWQDDVVFVYPAIDCYIFEDHVWQVGVQAAHGVRMGDARTHIKEILGGETYDFDDGLLFKLPSGSWEMMMRVNFDAAGKARAIFIYRSDM